MHYTHSATSLAKDEEQNEEKYEEGNERPAADEKNLHRRKHLDFHAGSTNRMEAGAGATGHSSANVR